MFSRFFSALSFYTETRLTVINKTNKYRIITASGSYIQIRHAHSENSSNVQE